MSWRTVALGEAVELQRGYDLPEQERRQGTFPIVGSAGPNGFHDKANVRAPGVVIGRSGAGSVQLTIAKSTSGR
jgi:type I restriction enzyme S subunit